MKKIRVSVIVNINRPIIFFSIIVIVLNFIFSVSAYSQNEIRICQASQISDKIFEFDVYAISPGIPTVISAYQFALSCNVYAINGGILNFNYVEGSSSLNNFPKYSVGVKVEKNIVKLCLASDVGCDTLGSLSKRIGRFRVTNTNSFIYDSLKLNWSFTDNRKTILLNNNFNDVTGLFNFFVPVDINPPAFLKAEVYAPTQIKLFFSEILCSDATIISNFSINNGITISNAALSSDKKSIVLTTTSHILYSSYIVTINNIKDISGNVITIGNTQSYTYNDKVIRYAEEGTLANGAALKPAAGSIGKQVAYCTSTSSTITFNVYLPKAGSWYVWGRFYFQGSGNSPNSFYINIDNGTKYLFGNNKNYFNLWHWGADGTVQKGTVKKLLLGTLSEGVHTITVSGYEVGPTVMIDQLLLSPDGNYIPTDAAAKLLKNENSDSDGKNNEFIESEMPKNIELFQNYPNPFNPVTRIKYFLNEDSNVKLAIYDLLGKEITTLVNEEETSGSYEVEFNPENIKSISSGIYIYTLITNKYVQSKKMTFLK